VCYAIEHIIPAVPYYVIARSFEIDKIICSNNLLTADMLRDRRNCVVHWRLNISCIVEWGIVSS
jgi:hypothetical protein